MYYYFLYHRMIQSDMPFAQLVPVAEEDIQKYPISVTIREGEIDKDILEQEKADIHYSFDEKRSWLCNRTCRFMVVEGKHIIYKLKEGMNEQYLRTYILGFGMSMLAWQNGELAMHCSALRKDGHAILLCGEPGAGKSTLSSQLLKQGWKLMADDMALVETREGVSYAKPAFPFQKLCRDAAIAEGYCLEDEIYIDEEKDKFLVRYRDSFALDELPITHLIHLGIGEGDEVEYMRYSGFDCMFACGENLFLRKLLGKKKYEPKMGQLLLKLAGSIKTYRLHRPSGKDTLQEIVRTVDLILKEG